MNKPDAMVKQLVAGSLLSVLASVVIGVLNYLTRRTMALNLPDASYGFFYSAFAFVMLFLAYLDLGLNSSGTILIARHDTHGRHGRAQAVFSIIFLVKLGGGLAVAVLLVACAPWLIDWYFRYPPGILGFVILCAFIPANALCGTVISTLDAYRDFAARNLFQTLKFLLIFVAVSLFATSAPDSAPAAAFAACAAVMFLLGMLFIRWKHRLRVVWPRGGDFAATWRETWSFGKWVALSTAGMTTMFHMDTLMLTMLKGLKSVAMYNVALPIMQIMQSVMILPLIFMPVATQLWQHRHRDELRGLVQVVVEACILFLWFIAVAMTCLRGLAIKLLFAERFLPAATALAILCAAMAVLVLGHFLINTLNAMEQPRVVARMVSIGVLVNILANAVLIPGMGIAGAALATLASYLVIAVLAYRSLDAALEIRFKPRTVIPASLAGALLAGGAAFWVPADNAPRAILFAAAALSVLGIVCLVFNHRLAYRLIDYARRRS